MNKTFDKITLSRNEVEVIIETSSLNRFFITVSDPSSQKTFYATKEQLEMTLEGINDLTFYNSCMNTATKP